MVFSSAIFLFLFLPLTLTGYFLFPNKYKNGFLLFASLFFYLWGESQVIPLLASLAVTYTAGRILGQKGTENSLQKKRKIALAIGIILNLSILFYYKYIGFFTETIDKITTRLLGTSFSVIEVALPLGISFYIFQSLSYLIDIYYKPSLVEKKITHSTLYIALFPQLIAGPIVRFHDIAREIRTRTHTVEDIVHGTKRFIIGLSKKVLIANNLDVLTSDILNDPVATDLTAPVAWFVISMYALQIYFDFSGYSDMAIGLGRIFGFTFPENFRYPYIAQSVREFWRRWHISLSSWFRDYVYIPLGGNRRGEWITYRNLAIVFLLTGLWHGASWNFVFWGLLHGLAIISERLFLDRILTRLHPFFRHAYLLLFILITWVFFRVEYIPLALYYLKEMIDISDWSFSYHISNLQSLVIASAILLASSLPERLYIRIRDNALSNTKNMLIPASVLQLARVGQYALFVLLLFLSCISLAASTHNPFIYFRF